MFRHLLPILVLAADGLAEIRPRTPAFHEVRHGTVDGRRVAYDNADGYEQSRNERAEYVRV